MGTYTSNYNLFMPSIGEQGWGDLVNGNFTTIDTTMKGLNNRIGTLETEGDAVAQRVGTLESQVSAGGSISPSTIETNTVTTNILNTTKLYVPFNTIEGMMIWKPAISEKSVNTSTSGTGGTVLLASFGILNSVFLPSNLNELVLNVKFYFNPPQYSTSTFTIMDDLGNTVYTKTTKGYSSGLSPSGELNVSYDLIPEIGRTYSMYCNLSIDFQATGTYKYSVTGGPFYI